MPLGGKYQRTPAMGMCAKLPTGIKDTSTATIMTWGYDCDIAKTAPYYGGMYAVIDAVAKAAAMGVYVFFNNVNQANEWLVGKILSHHF